MGWTKRADYFKSVKPHLEAAHRLVKDAVNGWYDIGDSRLVRTLLWHHLFDYHAICNQLGNGKFDGSVRRNHGVSINSKPIDTTELVLGLLSYEDKLTFRRPKNVVRRQT